MRTAWNLGTVELIAGRVDDDKPMWLEGSARLYHADSRALVDLGWNLKTTLLHASVSLLDCGEPRLCLSAAAGVFAHLSIAMPRAVVVFAQKHLLRGVDHHGYEGVNLLHVSRIDDWTVHWEIAHPDGSWHSSTPRWRNGSWCIADAIWGKVECTEETLSGHGVNIPLPEGCYRWSISLLKTTIKRPRWPRSHVVYGYDAKPASGEHIPFPGKGENSWDCGPDALHGSGGPARTVAEAIGSIVQSVLDYRLRYGGAGSLSYVAGGKYDTGTEAIIE